MKPIHYGIPFFNLLLAALLGLLLRSAFVFPIEGMTFLYVLHGHSHVALLGWLYLLVYVLLVHQFAVQNDREDLWYRRLFWITQFAVMGMAVTFPFQGYAAPSIFFSTLHILCSYAFVYRLWRYHRVTTKQQILGMKTALFFMAFSTLGVWFLGPAIGMLGKASAFFQLCIQFFLHFQFDGWFFTAFIVLCYSQVFPQTWNHKQFKYLYLLWIVSVLLTYGLPANWYINAPVLYYLNSVGVVLQAVVLFAIIKPMFLRYVTLRKTTAIWENLLFLLAIGCMSMRLVFQLLTLIEPIAIALKGMRGWIVGFIHLNMLGIFTALGLWLLIQKGVIKLTLSTKIGCVFLLLGFVFTEALLGLQGVQQFWRVLLIDTSLQLKLLFWFSVLLPASAFCFLFSIIRNFIIHKIHNL